MRAFNELSAGQHQRVAIARGLAQNPKLLILDEPTANLDARYQIMVTRLLKETAKERGVIVLMISHDLNIAARFADTVLLMTFPGTIYKCGTPEDVITPENVRRAYGVNCEVTEVDGRPHVILLDEVEELEDMDDGFEERGPSDRIPCKNRPFHIISISNQQYHTILCI